MNQKQIITGMMPAIARYNAALPPRWGRVVERERELKLEAWFRLNGEQEAKK